MIYTCGLRPQKGRNLKTENIDFKTGKIHIIHSKRGKERMVVMSDDMKKLAVAYNEKRKVFCKSSEYFFPSWKGENLTQHQVDHYLKMHGKRQMQTASNLPGSAHTISGTGLPRQF